MDYYAKFICIECSAPIDSLYVEFTGLGNIRLTRCPACGDVADKYIEYELVLVLVDIILHRRQAYRHLLKNRKDFFRKTSKWVIFWALAINMSVKAIALHSEIVDKSSLYKMTGVRQLIHLTVSTALEHFSFIATMALVLKTINWPSLNASKLYTKSSSHLRRVLYIALSFPEFFKTSACLLQMFDNEPTSLFLIGALITSIQLTSLQSITNLPADKLFIGTLVATCVKLIMRCIFYSFADVLRLGIII